MSQTYVTLKIPKELADKIDKCIDEAKAGYQSRAEFVKETIRNKLKDMKTA